MLLRICLVSFLLASCGSSGGGGGGSSKKDIAKEYAVTVNTADDLPACDADHEGSLVYVVDSKIFKHCKDSAWAEIDLKGTDGKDGATGAKGADGTNGANGSDNRISVHVTCTTSLSQATASTNGLTVSAGGLILTYQSAILASGDRLSNGAILSGSIQTSGSSFYGASQAGATSGPVLIGDDYVGPLGYGYWILSYTNGTLSGLYTDSDLSTTDTRTFTFPSADCTSTAL